MIIIIITIYINIKFNKNYLLNNYKKRKSAIRHIGGFDCSRVTDSDISLVNRIDAIKRNFKKKGKKDKKLHSKIT